MGKHRLKRELVDMPLGEIHPYERNPRKNDMAVEPLMQSIRANGFNAPIIVDEKGVILAGHTRYKAAQKLGLKTAPCVVVTGLGESQKRAYRIADNKIAELAKWDFSDLDAEMEDIDWGELEADAGGLVWDGLDGETDWPDMAWDARALGFSETEMEGLRMDADVGAMLDSFEGTSPVRERERQREEGEPDGGGDGTDRGTDNGEPEAVTFTARGNYQDFGEDFWRLAGELYARGIKTETKWGKK
jgi:hypothetical protein